ncbi:MAG: hypothetical protein HC817_06990 [Saprospiraceae bacterium]|nr:hypothetical protein [Saprospiraceae bacterium]
MITAILKYDNKILDLRLNKSTISDALFVAFTEETTVRGRRYKLDIHPKQDILLQNLEIKIVQPIDPSADKVFCNGFQTESESRMYGFDEKPAQLRSIARSFMGAKGDSESKLITRKALHLHSWSFSYLKKPTNRR